MEKCGLGKFKTNESIDLFRVNEGLADWLTKHTFTQHALVQLLPPEKLAERQYYVDTVRPRANGVVLQADDIRPVVI